MNNKTFYFLSMLFCFFSRYIVSLALVLSFLSPVNSVYALDNKRKLITDSEVEETILYLNMYGSVMSAIIHDDYEAALILFKYANDNSSKHMIDVLNSALESKKRELSKEQIDFIYKMMWKGSYDANDYLFYLFMSAYKASAQHLSKAQIEFINNVIERGFFDVDTHIIFEGFPKRGIYTKDVTHTLLSFALHFGLIDMFNHLLNAGADINAQNGSVLINAAEAGDIAKIRFALDNGARIDVPDLWRLQDAMDSKLKLDEISLLLEYGLKLDKNRLFGMAISRNRLDVVKLMVELGVDPARSGVGLYTAIEMGDCDLVKYLLDCGLKIRGGAPSAGNHLACAIRKWDAKIVELLVKNGADLNETIEGGNYFNYANSCLPPNKGSEDQKDKILKFLLTGKPINHEIVVKTENEQLTDLLYAYGTNEFGWSALNMALEMGQYEDALFLLKHGADFREGTLINNGFYRPIDRIFIEPFTLDRKRCRNTKEQIKYRTSPIPPQHHEVVRTLLITMISKGLFDSEFDGVGLSKRDLIEQIGFNKWYDILEEVVKITKSQGNTNGYINWEDLYQFFIQQNDERAIETLGTKNRHISLNKMLLIAIKNDNVHMSKYFILNGADVNQADEITKKKPLQVAKKREIIELLVAKGAKIG